MDAFQFVRRADGLIYEFVRDGEADGTPVFTRADHHVSVRRVREFGWSVVQPSGEVSSRPFDDPGLGDLPPEGAWVSRKGDSAYVYDLIRR